MKAIIKNWLTRTFMTILVIASVVAIVKTSVLHETLKNIAACACLMVSWLCARAVWPRKQEEPVTQPIQPAPMMMPMPTVHLDHVDLPMPTPYADVMDAWLRAEQRGEMQQLLGEQQEGDEG